MALWVSVGSLSQRNVLHLLSWSLGQRICLKIVAIIWICLQTWSTMLPTYSLFFYQVLYTFNSTLKQTSNLLQTRFQNWQTTVKRFKKMTWATKVRKKPNVQHLLQAKLLKPSISLPFYEKKGSSISKVCNRGDTILHGELLTSYLHTGVSLKSFLNFN